MKSTQEILSSSGIIESIRRRAEEVEGLKRTEVIERVRTRPLQPTDSVVESNALARSEYYMTANENRLLKLSIAKLNSTLADADQLQDIPITAKEFKELFEIEPKNTYRDMEQAATRLLKRQITIQIDKDKTTYNLLTQVTYRKHEGTVLITINPRLAIHFIGLKQQYTQFMLEGMRRFKLFSSARIYELMKSVESQGHYEIGIDAFKVRILADAKKYPRYSDLKKRVLEPALAEINGLSDIEVSYEPVRESRKIKKIRFKIKKNNQQHLDLE